MKYLLLIAILLPVAASAQPQIQAVDGVISNTKTVTIMGQFFGAKSPAAPLKWDNFEAGSNGTQLSTVQSEWVEYVEPGALYTTNTAHSGNLSVMNDTNRHEFATNYIDLPHSDEIFISYWWSTLEADTGDYGVIKLCRINSSHDAGGDGRYNGVGETYLSNMNPRGPDSPYFAYNPGTGNTGPLGYVRQPLNDWGRIDMYKKLSTPGQSNGAAFCNNITTQRTVIENNVVTRDSGFDFQLDTVLLGLMLANAQGYYGLYLDDIYIDNTLARVELGNNASFSACSHREMQIPSAWDAQGNVIQVTVNTGSFTDGDSAWMFVVDENGSASEGFPVVISQGVVGPGRPGQPVRD